MSKLLVVGATGLIGSSLAQKLVSQGHEVWGLSRYWGQKHDSPPNIHPLSGDVTLPNLGLGAEHDSLNRQFESVYHCAGSINLGHNADDLLFKTNVLGTKNVVEFCKYYNIPHLFFVSTAYAGLGHNYYEQTKQMAEKIVTDSDIPKITIFRPSIVLGDTDGHFSRFIETLIMIHRRAEVIRRKAEGVLHLPVIEPVFRIRGNPDGHLNLVKVNDVTTSISLIQDEGIHWLTNPYPLTLKELGEMVGKAIMVNIRFEQNFHAMPLEIAFEKICRPFIPYLQGEQLNINESDLPGSFIDQAFIDTYIKRLIYRK